MYDHDWPALPLRVSLNATFMTRTIAIGIALIAAVNLAGWVIVVNPGRSPFDDPDLLLGSRSFSEPWGDPNFVRPEKNSVPADVEKILTSAEQFTLLSLDPEYCRMRPNSGWVLTRCFTNSVFWERLRFKIRSSARRWSVRSSVASQTQTECRLLASTPGTASVPQLTAAVWTLSFAMSACR
jgi:hypothetical protein